MLLRHTIGSTLLSLADVITKAKAEEQARLTQAKITSPHQAGVSARRARKSVQHGGKHANSARKGMFDLSAGKVRKIINQPAHLINLQ